MSRQRRLLSQQKLRRMMRILLQHINRCCDIINELKADISVAGKENYVTTIKAAESEISVTTENFYVVIENGREMR